VIEQLHIAHERQADEPIEPGVGAEPGGLAGQREKLQVGMLARRRSQKLAIALIEGELKAGVGGNSLRRLKCLLFLDLELKLARLTVFQPEGIVIRRC
jgi:hypothetical protein